MFSRGKVNYHHGGGRFLLQVTGHCFTKTGSIPNTAVMADIEPEFDVEKDLSEFLSSVLDRTEKCIHNSETDINDLQANDGVMAIQIPQRIWPRYGVLPKTNNNSPPQGSIRSIHPCQTLTNSSSLNPQSK